MKILARSRRQSFYPLSYNDQHTAGIIVSQLINLCMNRADPYLISAVPVI